MSQSKPVAVHPRPTVGIQALWLVISIVVCFAVSAIGAVATMPQIDGWYAGIIKPSWNPPNWVFGPVWTTLYLMMAIAVWLVWKRSGFRNSRVAMIAFGAQLILNSLWSVLFFGMHRPGLAAIEIVFLWFAIIATIALFFRHTKTAAWLLVPYLLWVSFASVLNFAIYKLNSG